jgi:cytidylate kinase
LARNLAEYLDFSILDSGLLYRVYAYFHNLNLGIEEIPLLIQKDISFKFNHKDVIVLNDQEDITSELRSEKMAKKASELSSLPTTRENLLSIQRNFYHNKGLVADGRDMGTVVFPEAKLKIFLTASAEIRAERRYLELQNRGQEVNMLALIDDIKQRDLKDSTRTLSPLIPAEDSVIIDSSEMSIEEVLSFTKKLTKGIE